MDAKISIEINAPLQQQRRPRFKISRLGLRGGEILALAVDEGCLGVDEGCQECFSFTDVPQTDLKHFNLESSLGYA